MANIIPSGTSEADSGEFTLLVSDAANLYMTGTADANAVVAIKIKAADGTFSTIGYLTKQFPAQVLTGAGTYKVTRAAAATAFGVERN